MKRFVINAPDREYMEVNIWSSAQGHEKYLKNEFGTVAFAAEWHARQKLGISIWNVSLRIFCQHGSKDITPPKKV